ncbi:hypothetical protein OQA88_10765 [Cercophora sp. LCS_1]
MQRAPGLALDNEDDKFRYVPLHNPGNIRLLHLLPHLDKNAPIACQLAEYQLPAQPMHLYEALSYSWGDATRCEDISLDGLGLSVTENLFEALLALRDRLLPRVLWVDAICINQVDNAEKQEQIRLMANIYSSAARVVVWLGTGKDGGEEALETISRMADPAYMAAPLDNLALPESIVKLLQRPWFDRIWVLQEVAAARDIDVLCGSCSVDGHAFSLALNSASFNATYAIPLDLQSKLRPVTFLMGKAIFRSRSVSGMAPQELRPIGELVDMYHSRQASIPHDKLFALFGMTDDVPPELSLDYDMDWEALFKNLIRFLFGSSVSVETWPKFQTSEIHGKASVLGKVTSVDFDRGSGQQLVAVRHSEATSGRTRITTNWTLPPSAKQVRPGDLACIMAGSPSPCIVRRSGNHCLVIATRAPCWEPHQETREFPHNLSLVWDWEGKENWELKIAPSGLDMAMVLKAVEEHQAAIKILEDLYEPCRASTGSNENLRALPVVHELGMLYLATERWVEARGFFLRESKILCQTQGPSHPDTVRSRRCLASTYKGQNHLTPGKLAMVTDILEHEHDGFSLQALAIKTARDYDAEVMNLLLHHTDKIDTTEAILVAAAENELRGAEILDLLLGRGGDEVEITENVMMAAVGNKWHGGDVTQLLLNRGAGNATITQRLVATAMQNDGRQGHIVKRLVLEQRGGAGVGDVPGNSSGAKAPRMRWLTRNKREPMGERQPSLNELMAVPPPTRNWEIIYGKPKLQYVHSGEHNVVSQAETSDG